MTKDGVLSFATVNHESAGDYQCLADNKIGVPAHGSVTLVVKREYSGTPVIRDVLIVISIFISDEPVFVKHFDYANTGIGYNAELQCTYTSVPNAHEIQWRKGNNPSERIRSNERYTITNDHYKGHNHTKLLIHNVKQQDLVEYFCDVRNEIGHRTEKITLGLMPTEAQLHDYKYELGYLYTNWTVHSVQPLIEFQIQYKLNTVSWCEAARKTNYVIEIFISRDQSRSTWQNSDAQITEKDHVKSNLWRIRGALQIPEGEYIFSARVKNSEGYAPARREHLVSVIQGNYSKFGFDSIETPDFTLHLHHILCKYTDKDTDTSTLMESERQFRDYEDLDILGND